MGSQYVQGHSEAILRGHQSRTATISCKHFLPLLKPTDHIFDVGCGPGSITATLAALIPQGKMIGIDSSGAVLEIARKQENLPANCTFQTADALALPFADSSFDVVNTSQFIAHMTDPVAAMRELRRVCKAGGFLACREGDIESPILYPALPGLDLFSKALITLIETGGAGPRAGRTLLKWAVDAGFEIDKVEFSSDTMTYAGSKDAAWWGQVNIGRVRDDQKFRESCLKVGFTEKDLDEMRDAWDKFAKDPTAVCCFMQGQVVCHK